MMRSLTFVDDFEFRRDAAAASASATCAHRQHDDMQRLVRALCGICADVEYVTCLAVLIIMAQCGVSLPVVLQSFLAHTQKEPASCCQQHNTRPLTLAFVLLALSASSAAPSAHAAPSKSFLDVIPRQLSHARRVITPPTAPLAGEAPSTRLASKIKRAFRMQDGSGKDEKASTASPRRQRPAPAIPRTSEPATVVVLSPAWIKKFVKGGVAGGLGASVANVFCSPIDVVRTQLQSNGGGLRQIPKVVGSIYDASSLKGFWKGSVWTSLGVFGKKGVYFASYEGTKAACLRRLGDGSWSTSIAAIVAGLSAYTATNPFFMVGTKCQLAASKAADTITAGQGRLAATICQVRNIWSTEGLRGFFKGNLASYFGIAEGLVFWHTFEFYKRKRLNVENQSRASQGVEPLKALSKAEISFASACSKVVAILATYPHEVVRTRLFEGGRYRNVWQATALVAREEGIRGLYGGMSVHIARGFISFYFLMLINEHIKDLLNAIVPDQTTTTATTKQQSRLDPSLPSPTRPRPRLTMPARVAPAVVLYHQP
ncbi:unnamed protein product [Vitrella brassicaformis CCMP3155]|uniref:Mitochondrial carrier protein n=1 Tax=Vitrella brassicaformis (strain CCMP3155) TaxID=1169540 RepID=A0A0G4F143_VITBC|nr:unnamed protein product [Vitrella brassicaformis CCMP3155]|eukprot:CEM04990.1 unnamed protein product [Vitrella brassicaformis CCMP3155]